MLLVGMDDVVLVSLRDLPSPNRQGLLLLIIGRCRGNVNILYKHMYSTLETQITNLQVEVTGWLNNCNHWSATHKSIISHHNTCTVHVVPFLSPHIIHIQYTHIYSTHGQLDRQLQPACNADTVQHTHRHTCTCSYKHMPFLQQDTMELNTNAVDAYRVRINTTYMYCINHVRTNKLHVT